MIESEVQKKVKHILDEDSEMTYLEKDININKLASCFLNLLILYLKFLTVTVYLSKELCRRKKI